MRSGDGASAAAMWFAALAARVTYLTHCLRGHVTVWKQSRPDLARCPGDILCETCDRVLWCRAYDPWCPTGREAPEDHWGATRVRPPPFTLMENLQQVLRLAGECPPGRAGDEIRRSACELTEAGSVRQRHAHRQRMLKAIGRIHSRRAHGRSASSDPSAGLLKDLTAALCQELRDADSYPRRQEHEPDAH